jgi:hypothetical protein
MPPPKDPQLETGNANAGEVAAAGRHAAKKVLQPAGVSGLNAPIPGCVVPIDEDHVIHAAGNLLVLQNLEDPTKFTVLPEHDRIKTLLATAFNDALQVSPSAMMSW